MDKINLQESLIVIGRNLALLRVNRRLKLETVAKDTGIDDSILSRIESGSYPSLRHDAIVKLANYYNATLSEVLGIQPNYVFHNSQINQPTTSGNIQNNEISQGWKIALDLLERDRDYWRGKAEGLGGN